MNDNDNAKSPTNARSPLGEVSFNPRAMEADTESDEDILWNMSRHCSSGEKENMHDSSVSETDYSKECWPVPTSRMERFIFCNSFIVWQPFSCKVKHSEFEYNYMELGSKCFVATGSIAGVVGSKHQVPLPARGILVKSSVE